ncbi:hypothetical protein TanjilG_22448 [Lupinus angustifolius]|uniref:Uncharacterized protein n=1 Tax=Lupinus angustifolius TaxID=3871 RepID=A0A4P1RSM9_LUPAN|nr:hypothetical protein TanjilG_22448 [Lupinus angustifolius]
MTKQTWKSHDPTDFMIQHSDLEKSCEFEFRAGNIVESCNFMIEIAIWWSVGFYLVVSGGDLLMQDAPRFYRYRFRILSNDEKATTGAGAMFPIENGSGYLAKERILLPEDMSRFSAPVRSAMAEFTSDGGFRSTEEVVVVSSSCKEGRGSSSRRRGSMRPPSMDADDFMNLLHGSDPVKVELNRLENEVRDKDRELSEAQAEIKALRLSERLREKAVEENLEIKKINDEKKASMAAQFAAEATLRRVHAAQKDDDMPPIEAILAPLEAELKLARQEMAKLQDDNKALDRLTKSKEAALLEAERTVQVALAKASMVDDLQNKNQELSKQIEICQEERKTLDRELARAKVTANRVAVVVANEWKDANDKVMPVKQWLEERRFLQGDMQQLRDKLAIVERTAKSEAQLKEKYLLRLKVLEDSLRGNSNSNNHGTSEGRCISNGSSRRQSLGGADNFSKLTSNGFLPKRTPSSQPRSSLSSSTILKHAKGTSKSFDGGTRSLERSKILLNGTPPSYSVSQSIEETKDREANDDWKGSSDDKPSDSPTVGTGDSVPGVLYDLLQKEVMALRKAGHEKDQSLKDKDDAIEMLAKKVDTLTKAMEVEAKKMRREVAAMEKEVAAMRVEKEQDSRAKRFSNVKAPVNSAQHQLISGRIVTSMLRTSVNDIGHGSRITNEFQESLFPSFSILFAVHICSAQME